HLLLALPILGALVFGTLALMAAASLKLLNLIADKQIEYAIAVRAAKPAVLHKILKGGVAGRAHHRNTLLIGFLIVRNSQKPGQQLAQGKFSVQYGAVLAQIHLPGALGAKI